MTFQHPIHYKRLGSYDCTGNTDLEADKIIEHLTCLLKKISDNPILQNDELIKLFNG